MKAAHLALATLTVGGCGAAPGPVDPSVETVRQLIKAVDRNDRERFSALAGGAKQLGMYGRKSTEFSLGAFRSRSDCKPEPSITNTSKQQGLIGEGIVVDVSWQCGAPISFEAWTLVVKDQKIVGASRVPYE